MYVNELMEKQRMSMEETEELIVGGLLELHPQVRVGGAAGHPVALEEGVEVEGGSAGDDGEASAQRDVVEGLAGEPDELEEMEFLVGADDVDEVVGYLVGRFAVVGEVLAGADVEAGVDLPAVGGDDFAVEGPGEGDGEARLARGGWAGDDEGLHFFVE